jgi:hypothetical protein
MTNYQRYMLIPIYRLVVMVVLPLLAGQSAYAENRALLIGVGEYQSGIRSLPGIPADLNNMRRAAALMGYRKDQIKVLENDAATYDGIRQAIHSHLVQGVTAEDRVLFYFSGHGSYVKDQNGDEADGVDEALVPYDASVLYPDSVPQQQAFVIDDELNQWLSQIPSQQLMVLIDACHSGSATRNVKQHVIDGVAYVAKFHDYPGMAKPERFGDTREMTPFSALDQQQSARWVGLSASADHEDAQATVQGSFFTRGLLAHLEQQSQRQSSVTPKGLRAGIDAYIKAEVPEGLWHTPQLSSSEQLAVSPILLYATPGVAAQPAEGFAIRAPQSRFILGERIHFELSIPQSGYLTIVHVSQGQQGTQLLPNPLYPNNFVNAGVLAFPTAAMPFELLAREPVGASYVYAFLTPTPLTLAAEQLNITALDQLSTQALNGLVAKGFKVVSKRKKGYASKWMIDVVNE